jgi:hypothetical protein
MVQGQTSAVHDILLLPATCLRFLDFYVVQFFSTRHITATHLCLHGLGMLAHKIQLCIRSGKRQEVNI